MAFQFHPDAGSDARSPRSRHKRRTYAGAEERQSLSPWSQAAPCFLRAESALFIRNVLDVQLAARDPDVLIKLEAFHFPILEQLHPFLCPAKIFQLHLLKLTGAKCEIARIDFVSKSFADLRDAKRQLLAR